jgi:hypothetical protein
MRPGSEQLDSIREDAPDQIAVVMTGIVASAQRARIAKKGTAPREACETASDWAFKNNIHFEGCTADDILVSSPPDSLLIDHGSAEVMPRDANVERVTEFTVAFPDDALTESKGGQRFVKDFKNFVEQAKESNGDCSVLNQGDECMNDCKENNFGKAFPFQFCHGCGGPKDQRSQIIKSDDCLKHVRH